MAGQLAANDHNRSRDFARYLRTTQTDAEGVLWYHLRGRRFEGVKFGRQHPIGPYVVDFYCPEHALIIELDGGQHDLRAGQDEGRTRFLKARGCRVLRFWNYEVLKETDAILSRIAEALAAPPPRPSPSPSP